METRTLPMRWTAKAAARAGASSPTAVHHIQLQYAAQHNKGLILNYDTNHNATQNEKYPPAQRSVQAHPIKRSPIKQWQLAQRNAAAPERKALNFLPCFPSKQGFEYAI